MKEIFEVLAIQRTKQKNQPHLMERRTFISLAQAMIIAQKWARIYHRVEVLDTFTDDDEFWVESDELVHCWENGVKTL